MDDRLILPPGMVVQPLTADLADAVVELVNACELRDSGRVMLERADLLADMSTTGYDRDLDGIVIVDGERAVAWAMVVHERSRWADVHPDRRGLGIGTSLLRWSEERGRAKGSDRMGQTVEDARTEVVRMLTAAGYTPRRTSWVLRMDHPDRPPMATFPDGVALKAFDPHDADELLAMFEQAFSEFEDRRPSTPASWRALTIEREGFDPGDLIVAVDGGEIVGGAFLIDSDAIWVDKIAVRRGHRHRGIARGLLSIAFGRSFERGYDHTSLSTDSNTGALTLYERIGMRVIETYTHLAVDL